MHYQRWRKYGDPEIVRVHRSRTKWTPNELSELEDLIYAGWSDERLAERFHASVNGIQLARKRHGIPSRTQALLCCRVIAAKLGIRCAKSVARWIERGWLKGRRGQPRGGNQQWYVTESALLTFLEDARHWQRWQPERITDPDLREWTLELRAGVRFLTLGEVAQRYYVEPATVGAWIQRGLLPAVRNGNHLVRESDLRGFIPPSQQSKAGMHVQRWNDGEVERLIAMREAGVTFQGIADALGRPLQSVSNRWYRVEPKSA